MIICVYFFLFSGIIIVPLFPCATASVFVYPYFIIGFLLNKYEKQIIDCKYTKIVALAPVIFAIMFFFFTKDCYISTTGLDGGPGGSGIISHMPINIFRWAIGLFGLITIIIFMSIGMRINIFNNEFGNIINLLGQKSLQVYTLSVVILSNYLPMIYRKVVDLIGKDIFSQNIVIYNYLFTPLLTVAYSIILIKIISLLEKLKINYVLFGR